MNLITTYQSPLDKLYAWECSRPDDVYMYQPVKGVLKSFTWRETAMEVRTMAGYLRDLHFPPGSKIALLSKNCAHWIICDLAIMMAGHISVPLFPNLSASSVKYILEHSDAILLFVGKLDEWAKMKTGVPDTMRMISFPDYPHEGCELWENVIQGHQPLQGQVYRAAEEVGTILYTSGTTGTPKGVVHRFNSFSFTTQNAIPWLGFHKGSRFFSYLPLSHSAERSLVEMGSLYCGGTVYFAESVETFPENLADAKPTEFLAVHHIWKKFQQRILEQIPQSRLSLLLMIPLVAGWIKKKIKKQLGLFWANNILAGASPTPVELMEWFSTIGIDIQEAYGLTENWSYSHINRKGKRKLGSVGQPFPGVETQITETEEILVRHPGIMKEYYKEAQKTAEALTADGFLRTEDSGYADEEGYLKITGRVKDIFKTSKGNYVAPAPIENLLTGNENIEFVCVTGQQLPQPLALIVLTGAGKSKTEEVLSGELQDLLEKTNHELDPVERLSKIVIVPDVWDVDQGILTPTFKVKRKEIEKRYASLYPLWESKGHKVVFA